MPSCSKPGTTKSEIARTMDVSRNTVNAVEKKVKGGEDLVHAPGGDRSRVISIKAVKADPNRRMSDLTKARSAIQIF